ncbi:MAG: hypothetical protein HOI89_09920, partial [Phycisphaerae bacterium]|nr:hypothetical protein [Phycisphaerae bacterium]
MNMLLLSALLLTPSPAPLPELDVAPTRCIVHYDGRHQLCGTLQSTDENSVHLTTSDGQTHVLPIPRIVGIEYLL